MDVAKYELYWSAPNAIDETSKNIHVMPYISFNILHKTRMQMNVSMIHI